MLVFLDLLLSIIHFLIIGINLLGWIWPKTRRLHLFVVSVTAFSWLVLGIWFGIGYCPVTDWQWRVKERLGETNLPDSFVTYYAQKIVGHSVSPNLVNWGTGITFAMVTLLSVYFNFFHGDKRKY